MTPVDPFIALALLAVASWLTYLLRRTRKANLAFQVEIHERDRAESQRQRYQDSVLRLDVWMRQLMMSAGREEQFYAMAAAGLLDLLNAEGAVIPLFTDGDRYIYGATAGLAHEKLPRSAQPIRSAGAFAWVGEHDEPLVINDLPGSDKTVPAVFHTLKLRSGCFAPIAFDGHVIGVLAAFRSDSPFDQIDRQIVLVYSQKVAIAVENMRLLAELTEEKERAEVTLHSIGDAVITTDGDSVIEYLNPVAEQLTGWTSLEAVGQPVSTVFRVINETTREPIEDPVQRCVREGVTVGIPAQSLLVRRDEKEFAIDDSAAPIRDPDGRIVGAVLVFHDCSTQRAMARQLSWQATHDALTGLANRRQFEERVRLALDSSRERDEKHVLMYMDLDQFKVVNDTCGHMAGDELLKQLTALLRHQVRDLDTLARLGGDEFGVLLVGCPLDAGMRIAEKIREVVKGFRFVWQKTTFEIGVSIGVIPVDAESLSLAALLSSADIACYTAKEQGRNRVYLYEDGENQASKRQGEMQWVSRIQSALDEDRFVLYAQSIIPSGGTDDLFSHVEILVRMIDEQGKIVPPGAFIPAAERYGLMGDIDRWVVRNVFQRYDGRLAAPRSGEAPMCAINLSGASMSDKSLLTYIRGLLDKHDVPPQHVCFEITETAAVQNLAVASEFITHLKGLGCKFALDDFGSGLSSFAYLKNLPVDYLKIDGGFVKDMLNDKMNRAIVEACHQIGQSMNIKTIAEFVEDDEIRQALDAIGVDYCQGWGIHKPEPLDGILAPEAAADAA